MKRPVYAYAFLVISAAVAPTFAAAQHVASSGTVRTNWETTGTLWESGTYAYDAAGNVKQIGTDRYAYDQYGRLVSATANTPASTNTQAFTYDRYGNLKSMTTTSASGTFRGAFAVVPSTNRLDGTCEQPYDVCHSRLHNPDTGAETGRYTAGEYQWDALGMLKELNGDRHERHIYDANDERIVTIQYTGNVEMTRRYSLRAADNKVLRELTLNVPANTWTVDRDYVHRGSTLMAAFTGAEAHPTRHYHPDHLGTPRVVTDADGYRLNIHTYLPFGREAEGSEPDTERLKFTGHERDSSGPASPGFDLDYMHARFYDPNVGRFLSIDPTWASADLGKPQSWNRYAYVMNNPVNMTDPDGQIAFVPVVMGALWVADKLYAAYEARQDYKAVKSGQTTVSEVAQRRALETTLGMAAGPIGRLGGKAAAKIIAKNADEAAEAVSRINKMSPEPKAVGPHTTFKRSSETGRVSGYETYDANGNPTKRFRGEGGPHGGQDPPVILEPKPNKGPGARPKVPRKPEKDELPTGY